jgi:PPP family 3-phenylpropionic acid transporter
MSRASSEAVPVSAFASGGAYFLWFACIGITQPYLAPYYRTLGFSGGEIGVLLSVGPVLSMVAPGLWGGLADRTGRADRIVRWLLLGSVLAWVPMLWATRFAAVLPALVLLACFSSSVSALLDALTITRVRLVGGSYARIRVWGSVGFIVSSTLFGLAVADTDHRVIVASLAVLAATWLFSLPLHAPAPPDPAPRRRASFDLLADPVLRRLLAATALHWMACAPSNGLFGVHVRALGLPPSVIGLSTGLAVSAEVAAMLAYPRLFARWSPSRVLAASFVASALRWAALSIAVHPAVIALVSLLHAFSFGTFIVAAVAAVTERVPDARRAGGQGLFVALTFGVGGLAGALLSGFAYDVVGSHGLFAGAAALELAPALLLAGRTIAPLAKPAATPAA